MSTHSDLSPTEAVNLDGGGAVLYRSARQAQPDVDQPFAILRYAKLRSSRSIVGSSQHMRRTHPTPNANPALLNSNRVLIGSQDPAADTLKLIPAQGARDASGRLLRRSNSVLAVEVLMTTSPQWWTSATPEQQAEWVSRSQAWLEGEWGAGNVAHLELHLDEATPHLTGLIVPLDRGGLNARAWIGGKASKRAPGSSLLSGHQTRYAEAVGDLGLRRGVMGSTARHTTVKEHYKALARAESIKVPEIGTPPLLGRDAWREGANDRLRQEVAAISHAAAELPIERQRRLAAERTATANAKALEEARLARRAQADQMRALPLPDVLSALGLEEDPKEPGLWKAGPKGARTHRISVKDQKWFDHVGQKGRGGAIDLVQYVTSSDFNGALSWLCDRFGTGATAAEFRKKFYDSADAVVKKAVQERKPFTLPPADAAAWPVVRKHLIEVRGLPADIVDAAHLAGDVYATSKPGRGHITLKNAVFIQRDIDGTPTGAEIKGVIAGVDGKHWSGLAPGSSKTAGVFSVGVQLLDAAKVFVVESAIDALSLFAEVRALFKNVAVLSTAGDNTMPEAVLGMIHPYATRYAAQDNNAAGDRQAERLGKGWKRLRPNSPFEDWNEQLVSKKSQSDQSRVELKDSGLDLDLSG